MPFNTKYDLHMYIATMSFKEIKELYMQPSVVNF